MVVARLRDRFKGRCQEVKEGDRWLGGSVQGGRKTAKLTREMKAWKKRQPRGAIMKPSTFKKIERKAAGSGRYRSAKAVAGKAYQRTLRAKFKGR